MAVEVKAPPAVKSFATLYDACKDYRATRVFDAKACLHEPQDDRNYKTAEGDITFQTHGTRPNRLVIFFVEVVEQRKGIFTRFLQQAAAADSGWSEIAVVCVGSYHMDDLLTKITLQGRKFVPHACDFYWARTEADMPPCVKHMLAERALIASA